MVQGRKTTLVQSLKQYHAHFYWLYQKGTTCAMVILQGLHLGNAFRCPNVSVSMGLKSFCPWCLKLGRNTKTIAIHLHEVHYRMAVVCNICLEFASMSAQRVLDHQSGCKTKCNKESAEHEGPMKAPKKRMSWGLKETSQSHGPDATKKFWGAECHSTPPASEHKLVHSLDHSRSSKTHFWVSLHSVRQTVIPLVYHTVVLASNNH